MTVQPYATHPAPASDRSSRVPFGTYRVANSLAQR